MARAFMIFLWIKIDPWAGILAYFCLVMLVMLAYQIGHGKDSFLGVSMAILQISSPVQDYLNNLLGLCPGFPGLVGRVD